MLRVVLEAAVADESMTSDPKRAARPGLCPGWQDYLPHHFSDFSTRLYDSSILHCPPTRTVRGVARCSLGTQQRLLTRCLISSALSRSAIPRHLSRLRHLPPATSSPLHAHLTPLNFSHALTPGLPDQLHPNPAQLPSPDRTALVPRACCKVAREMTDIAGSDSSPVHVRSHLRPPASSRLLCVLLPHSYAVEPTSSEVSDNFLLPGSYATSI